ncbi:MAG: DUF3422 domain-containing protein [Hyphomicrobiales bacterium]|nr:MAG: DUF3422 domain-containing protein [Hyphomicrobiales bacterium]
MPLEDHPLRQQLNDEVHARPPEALSAPLRSTYIAMLSPWENADHERALISSLAERFGGPPVRAGATHYSSELAGFSLRWERHGEFARYMFTARGPFEEPFASVAAERIPPEWLAKLPGQRLVAANVALVSGDGSVNLEEIGQAHFAGNVLVGSVIADGAGAAFTDFRIHADGMSRVLVEDRSMSARQAGRMVQRLLEIDTYRMLALLALPIARELGPKLSAWEKVLAEINTRLIEARSEDEASLQERLTHLSAEIDSVEAAHHFRFGAAAAYRDIVLWRIAELREGRIQGLQTFREFMERRLTPAMNTCEAISRRQASLAQRVARSVQLLSIRIGMTREQQNHALLRSMDRRAKLQLRLQQTVEGLSVAAITYYVVGLVAGVAKGLKAMNVHIDPEIAAAVAIPVVAGAAILGLRHLRALLADEDGREG